MISSWNVTEALNYNDRMASIYPFRALRPAPDQAAAVSSVPYDVVSTDEARQLAAFRAQRDQTLQALSMALAAEGSRHKPDAAPAGR